MHTYLVGREPTSHDSFPTLSIAFLFKRCQPLPCCDTQGVKYYMNLVLHPDKTDLLGFSSVLLQPSHSLSLVYTQTTVEFGEDYLHKIKSIVV